MVGDGSRERLKRWRADMDAIHPPTAFDRMLTVFIVSGFVCGVVFFLCLAAVAAALTVKFVGWLAG